MSSLITQPEFRDVADSSATPQYSFSVVVEHTTDTFESWIPMLDELATEAVEPNIFYESWMLLAAMENYVADRQLVFLMVMATDPEDGKRFLCGFFPMEARKFYRGVPLHNIALWCYPHCFLETPLLHRRFVRESLQSLMDWFHSERKYGLMALGQLSAQGDFHRQFKDVIAVSSVNSVEQIYERAFFRPDNDAESYLASALSSKARREYRRLQRQLSESGELQWETLPVAGAVNAWIDEFLCLEASGWKGRSGTALHSSEGGRVFFRKIATEAFQRRRLLLLALRLDDKPIAMITVLLGGDGAYAFKMGIDENYRHFAPGVLLLIELVRRLHVREGFSWLDSCATPENVLTNRLWLDRKPLCNLIVAKPNTLASGILRFLPTLSRVKKRLVRITHGNG